MSGTDSCDELLRQIDQALKDHTARPETVRTAQAPPVSSR